MANLLLKAVKLSDDSCLKSAHLLHSLFSYIKYLLLAVMTSLEYVARFK
jgi:hypothetical protein